MVMIDAPRIESRAASWTRVAAAQILGNRQYILAVTAKNSASVALVITPNDGFVTGQLRMTTYAGIEGIAAFQSNSYNVAR